MTDHHHEQAGPGQRRSWIPDTLGDRYEIDRELGSGAAAVTVAAMDRKLGRRVAIKILKPESEIDPGFSDRFAREARAAASINHPNVVSVYDVGQDDDILYLVMHFVDGSDLKGLITQQGALPWKRAVAIARSVLAGLAAIHETGIVHRDIKPQNVLVGEDGSIKVTDFGVAHVDLESQLTSVGMTVGTASYMAPEQAQGQTPTPAADVYAVGVMLYEMVSGRLPFNEPTSVATMLAHIQRSPAPPRAPAGMEALPEGVVGVIRQAMAKDPDQRFRGALAMRQALSKDVIGGTGGTTAAVPVAGDRTEVVSSVPPVPRRPPTTNERRPEPSRQSHESGRSGGGFGTVVVTFLVVLALGLLGAAGALWYLEQQSDDPPEQNQVGPAPETVEAPTPTPSPEPEQEEPAVIEPPATETPSPTETPVPEVQLLPTEPPPTEISTPTPTPTPPQRRDGNENPQIIEPIDGTTVPSDPGN